MTAQARDEVVGLHQFLERWLIGTLDDSDAAFRRFTGALHPSFTMIVPSGEMLDRSAVANSVRAAHATVGASFAIEIRDVVDHMVGNDAVLVTYEEWQRVEGRIDTRRTSTALFVAAADAVNGVQWRHLHETFRPVEPADAQSSGG